MISGFWINLPIILGILLLIALIKNYVSMSFLYTIENKFLLWVFVDILWGLFAGNPINSYIIASEFWPIADNIIIIWTFLISWVTVGIVQIPAESYYFGKKYTIIRNILAFIFSLIWAYTIALLYTIF